MEAATETETKKRKKRATKKSTKRATKKSTAGRKALDYGAKEFHRDMTAVYERIAKSHYEAGRQNVIRSLRLN